MPDKQSPNTNTAAQSQEALEAERKQRNQEHLQKILKQTPPEGNESADSQKNSDNGLASDASFTDINNKSQSDSDEERYKNILANTFNNDPVKAVKSWTELQKTNASLSEKAKISDQANSVLSKLDRLKESDPKKMAAINAMLEGSDISEVGKLLGISTEPRKADNQSQQTATTKSEGIESVLIREGFLTADDLDVKNYMTASEWQLKLSDAMSERTAHKSFEKVTKLEDDRRTKNEQEAYLNTIEQQSRKRIEDSFNETISHYKVDFGGEHANIFEEVRKTAFAFRDPNNLDMISDTAFEDALLHVTRKRGVKLEEVAPQARRKQTDNSVRTLPGGMPSQQQPKTVHDEIREKRMNQINNMSSMIKGRRN